MDYPFKESKILFNQDVKKPASDDEIIDQFFKIDYI